MLKKIIERSLGIIFPRRCPICEKVIGLGKWLICDTCARSLAIVREPTCKACGKEVMSDQIEYCFDCARHPRSFDAGVSLLKYDEIARVSMAAIKYKNRREYLDFYAQALAVRYTGRIKAWSPDELIPVPTHPSRRRQRGFNQAEQLALRLEKLWGIPTCSDLLVRRKRTAPQKQLTPQERLRNLKEAFVCNPATMVGAIPHTVVLIDDIYTTGSTAEACTQALKAIGVERVYIITLCIGGV